MARLNYFVVTFDNRGVGTTKIHGIEPFRQRVASGEEKIMPNLEFLYAGNFEKASSEDPALFSYDDMANDVVEILDFYKIEKAHILGASMGGQITTLVGIRNPTRCLSLTVIMSASPINEAVVLGMKKNAKFFKEFMTPEFPQIGDSLEEAKRKFLGGRASIEVDGIMKKADQDALKGLEFFEIDFKRGGADLQDPNTGLRFGDVLQSLAQQLWLTTDEYRNIDMHLRNINIPTIFIGGIQDPIIPIEMQRETCNKIIGARIYEFNCGHEMPSRFTAAYVSILNSHFIASSGKGWGSSRL